MLNSLPEIHSVFVEIRDAVAPVFLLTGVGSILFVLVNRLGRAVAALMNAGEVGAIIWIFPVISR
jgi:hypothetical protein